MKFISVIHNDIWPEVLELLPYDKAETVTVLRRDAEWEVVTDNEGNSHRRFVQNGEPYEIIVNKTGGSYVEIGMIGKWHVVMLGSKASNLQAINQLSADKVLGLAVLTTNEEGNVSGWDSVVDEDDRMRVSMWMKTHSYGEIPEGGTARQATRLLWRNINAELDENSMDITD